MPQHGARTDDAATLDTVLSAATPTTPAPPGPAPSDISGHLGDDQSSPPQMDLDVHLPSSSGKSVIES
jgi:hypothetical protein